MVFNWFLAFLQATRTAMFAKRNHASGLLDMHPLHILAWSKHTLTRPSDLSAYHASPETAMVDQLEDNRLATLWHSELTLAKPKCLCPPLYSPLPVLPHSHSSCMQAVQHGGGTAEMVHHTVPRHTPASEPATHSPDRGDQSSHAG